MAGASRHLFHKEELMLSKPLKSAVALAALLLTAQTQATDSNDPLVPERSTAHATNRALAREAVDSATEDAIRSVLQSTRANLDIRLSSRKSAQAARQTVDGR
ncbi:MAG: hypothetical protein R3192_09385 [Woeseiaceae bacterium]|nr:hypothetical protein [Woeseiaceae bacterium]